MNKMPFLIDQSERNTNLLYIKIKNTWVFYFPDRNKIKHIRVDIC